MMCKRHSRWRTGGAWAAAGLLVVGWTALAGADPGGVFARRAAAAFHRAQRQWRLHTNDTTAAWQFARACFDLADFATNDLERARIAREGIAACRRAIAQRTNAVAAHYYLGMNLGQLARTETLGAFPLVRQMEGEFKMANRLDARFDYAGPARCLGLLYRDAPGWPLSLGSRRKARRWLQRAVELAPKYPENCLNLIESRLQWHDRAAAASELRRLELLWPAARTNFTGEVWERSWSDWLSRKRALEKSLAQSPQATTSPRNRR